MTKANSTQIGFAIEDTYRTAQLDSADDTAYRFGDYDDSIQKWNSMEIENLLDIFNTYNSRTPSLITKGRSFAEWQHTFNPLTPQFAVFMLGKCTDASPDTFEANTVGTTKKALTIRWQEQGGSNDRVVQAVGCYATECYCRAALNSPFTVQEKFNFSDIEDDGDSRPILTNSPGLPAGVSETYDGNPIVTYDYGGGGEATLTDVIMAEWSIKQNFKIIADSDKQGQKIYLYEFTPVDIILTALMESDSKWDDFIDLSQKDYAIKVQKPDATEYIKNIFTNCYVTKISKSSEIYKGLVTSKLILQGEAWTGEFVTDVTDTWANHFVTAT